MRMPRFDNTWTFGNTITIAAMAAGLIGLWNEINSEVLRQAATIEQALATLDRLQTEAAQREARVRALELGASRTDEKLINIIAALDRIEKRLEGQN